MERLPIASLVYYPDDRPGIRRLRRGRGFSYLAPDGTRIDDAGERRRIGALGVPPAYEDVWISPLAHGHLQATGRDVRQRKQYRYHDDWTAFRSRQKYDQLVPFGMALPRLRRRVAADLSGEAGEQSFAIAAVVAMIDRIAVRVGHPEYAEENGSFGATTIRSRHVRLEGGEIRLAFTGKGGRKIRSRLRDRRLHQVLQRLDDLPGRELVSWLDTEGNPHRVSSEQVNAYIADAVACDGASAKTFRTWSGSLAAFERAVREEKPTIRTMSEAAAERLSNTPSIARTSYIHPAILSLKDADIDDRTALLGRPPPVSGLRKAEGALLAFLSD